MSLAKAQIIIAVTAFLNQSDRPTVVTISPEAFAQNVRVAEALRKKAGVSEDLTDLTDEDAKFFDYFLEISSPALMAGNLVNGVVMPIEDAVIDESIANIEALPDDPSMRGGLLPAIVLVEVLKNTRTFRI